MNIYYRHLCIYIIVIHRYLPRSYDFGSWNNNICYRKFPNNRGLFSSSTATPPQIMPRARDSRTSTETTRGHSPLLAAGDNAKSVFTPVAPTPPDHLAPSSSSDKAEFSTPEPTVPKTVTNSNGSTMPRLHQPAPLVGGVSSTPLGPTSAPFGLTATPIVPSTVNRQVEVSTDVSVANDSGGPPADTHEDSSIDLPNPDDKASDITERERQLLKMQKTKSQELREFTSEFVLSTTLDFDPMSFQDHTPTIIRSSVRRTGDHPVKAAVEPPPPSPRPAAVPQSTTDQPASPPPPAKQEMVPSESFLTSLNQEAGASSEESSAPASKRVSVEGEDLQQKLAVNNNNRKANGGGMVSSETSPVPLSSILSSTTTEEGGNVTSATPGKEMKGVGASSDLLEWSKSILSNYNNVKVGETM